LIWKAGFEGSVRPYPPSILGSKGKQINSECQESGPSLGLTDLFFFSSFALASLRKP
jgi:hypothetical protein